MCSRPFRPLGFPIYVARRPAAPFARCFPRSFTFYVADPISSIETRSLPTSLAATHRGFAFYVAFPESSIPDRDVFYVADPISSIAFVCSRN